MADATDPKENRIATELPTKYLPGVEYRDLPEPVRLRRIVGPSVILLALAIGGGELIIWPYITTQVGMGILWLAAVGFLMQYFLNMEVERYTLATGETAATGFTRLWKPWGIILVVSAIITNFWPGWATGGATVVTFIFGLDDSAVPIISVTGLLFIGLVLTLSPVVYKALEKIQFVFLGIIVLFLIVAIIVATEASSWASVVTQAPSGVANFPNYMTELGGALILGAIAFAGAGGAGNLAQSNWIRDKGMGMGQRIPRIVSPITGEEETRPSLGYMFRTDEENMRRWKGWWKVANQEQFFTFFVLGVVTLISLAVLVNSTIGIREVATDLEFIRAEGEELKSIVAPWFGVFFNVAAVVILFSTNMVVVDWISRFTADSLKVSFLAESRFWSESKIYFTGVWILIITGSIILLSGLSQPIVLLLISGVGNGLAMAFYLPLLIHLNRRALPEPIKLRGVRLVAMVTTSAIFIGFALFLLFQLIVNGSQAI